MKKAAPFVGSLAVASEAGLVTRWRWLCIAQDSLLTLSVVSLAIYLLRDALTPRAASARAREAVAPRSPRRVAAELGS